MATSNNSISGINIFNYKINSHNELKIDISILYFLEDEISTRLSEYSSFDNYIFEREKKKYFDFIRFYKFNEKKYDVFMKIEYTSIDDDDYYSMIFYTLK